MKEFKISHIKYDKDKIETYSEHELKLLMKKPNLKECNFIEYRNNEIYNFLLATGCRVQTLVNIKVKDLNFKNYLISYGHTKNRRTQIVPMSNSLKVIIIEYLQYRKGKEEEHLFTNAFGDKLKTNILN